MKAIKHDYQVNYKLNLQLNFSTVRKLHFDVGWKKITRQLLLEIFITAF